MLTTRQTKRLATIVLCAFLANSFHYFLPSGRFLQSLPQTDVAGIDDIRSALASASSEVNSVTDDDSCWRKCPQGRVNRIFYKGTGPRGGAGLNDREFVITDLAELAGYLCAKLVVSKPYQLLNEDHNNGKMLSHNLLWKDLFNVKFAEDDTPVIIENEYDIRQNDYEGYLRVISQGASWKADFEKVQEHSWTQEQAWRQGNHNAPGFVWELIYSSPYNNDLTPNELPQLKPDLQEKVGHHYNPEVMKPQLRLGHFGHGKPVKPEGCKYTEAKKDEVPDKVLMVRAMLIQRLKELSPNSTFGTLHLRRGDAINQCDTHVTRVKKYLECSLQNTEEKGHLTILMMSDEKDDKYRQDILNLANDYSHVTMLDFDKINVEVIEEAIETGKLEAMFENNYFEFDVETGMDLFKFFLERRRAGNCHDCTPLAELM